MELEGMEMVVYDRRFDPERSPLHIGIPTEFLIVYDADKKISHIRKKPYPESKFYITDDSSMVISINAACLYEGLPWARASAGMFLGEGSPGNASFNVFQGYPQTSHRAEIMALFMALGEFFQRVHFDSTLSNLYIRSDSKYLVMAMTEWIYTWIQYGAWHANGQPVEYFELFKRIHDTMNERSAAGMSFNFWYVEPENNVGARDLADEATFLREY